MFLNRTMTEMDPWQELSRLQNRMNRLFNDADISTQRPFPAINLWTNKDTAMITAELPGLDIEDIKLSVMDQNVILEGNRNPKPLKEDETYHRQERGYGSFQRSIELPFSVDTVKADAKFKNGVLTITLPRSEEDKPKRITIQP